MATFTQTLRAGGDFSLAHLDPRSTPGFKGNKKHGTQALEDMAPTLADLQERLYAESKEGGTRSLLLVVQGMDTSGKGGIMRHVVGRFDPQGVKYTAFKAPTEEERRHDFLWRIRKGLPVPGQVGVFDRSHYEDVLIVRVHNLVPANVWHDRYALINEFEREVTASGCTVVKVMLHISSKEQKKRLRARLTQPEKNWKWNPGDVDERKLWPEYQKAYQAALAKCSTDVAPWFVVPADRKWYARLAVSSLLLEHLDAMDLTWPAPKYDVKAEMARLAAT